MISIENLSMSYGGKRVINGLNLSLQTQAIHGIVGLNGSGKTTLLNTVYGLRKADDGKVIYQGNRLSKKVTSYLATENFFYSDITGRDYLSLFAKGVVGMDEWNALFQLPLEKLVEDYSTGMKKKLALIAVLMLDKPVMILDEPFNGLDMETCRIIRSLLLRLKENGKTIIITSHILETLTNVCDQIHYLEKGKIANSIGKEDFATFERDINASIELRNEEMVKRLTGEQMGN